MESLKNNKGKTTEKLISIIIPVYNCEKYIERLIKNIITQSYQNFEVIIINDGSTDKTKNIIERYSKYNSKINIINKENTGVSDCRNIGIKIARGEIILFADSDDFLEQDYFKKIIEIYTKYPNIEMINFGYYSDVENLDGKNISRDIFNYKEKIYSNKLEIKRELVELWDKKMLYNVWNKAYKKEIISKYNLSFPDFNWGEDIDFNRKYMDVINNFYNSNKAFYHYVRERKGAVTKEYKKNFFEIRKKEYKEFNEYFKEMGLIEKEYREFSARRFIESVLGVIENLYCTDLKFKERYTEIKKVLSDEDIKKTLKVAKPNTNIVKIMLIPIKCNWILATMIMGKLIHIIKNKRPDLFNHLKNKR